MHITKRTQLPKAKDPSDQVHCPRSTILSPSHPPPPRNCHPSDPTSPRLNKKTGHRRKRNEGTSQDDRKGEAPTTHHVEAQLS